MSFERGKRSLPFRINVKKKTNENKVKTIVLLLYERTKKKTVKKKIFPFY